MEEGSKLLNSIDRLFPWIVTGLGFFLFTFGLWGITGGIIMIAGAFIYLYNNNHKAELKSICWILAAILVIKLFVLLLSQLPR